MTQYPLLYSFRRCPYAIRARLALANSDIKVELREVKLSDKPAEFLVLSSKATVPVLQLVDGRILEESLDIIEWALSNADPDGWLVEDKDALINENDNVFKPLLDRYKYADRFPQLSQQEHRVAALPFLTLLDSKLQGSDYLTGSRLSRVDISIMPFIRQFAGVEPDWFAQSEFIALRHWLQKLIDSHLFKMVMHKYSFWEAGDASIYL